jgi:hypothetical protein
LITKDGKFVYLEEESRPDPNATEFMIVTADSPQLDASNLVVGRVVDGYDVIKKITEVKVVNDNSGSGYFQYVLFSLSISLDSNSIGRTNKVLFWQLSFFLSLVFIL